MYLITSVLKNSCNVDSCIIDDRINLEYNSGYTRILEEHLDQLQKEVALVALKINTNKTKDF